jgi:4-hydroxybenzoate polyprenyltransferase
MMASPRLLARLRRARRQAWVLVALSLALQAVLAWQAHPLSGALHAAPAPAGVNQR